MPKSWFRLSRLVLLAIGMCQAEPLCAQVNDADPKGIAFFEAKIRPVLVKHCYQCHSQAKQVKGKLRLDSRPGWETGGDTGPAIVPGDVDKSLLVKAISFRDPDLQMPPKQKLSDKELDTIDVTRPWMDGGRDAVGHYRIGTDADAIKVEFALEAKCFGIDHGVGVKATSRLISRLRFRQFGILVTTSFLDHQAYEEIRQDGHPVVVMSAGDIARLLVDNGLATSVAVRAWLAREFPIEATAVTNQVAL
jgi:hypothetical protein